MNRIREDLAGFPKMPDLPELADDVFSCSMDKKAVL